MYCVERCRMLCKALVYISKSDFQSFSHAKRMKRVPMLTALPLGSAGLFLISESPSSQFRKLTFDLTKSESPGDPKSVDPILHAGLKLCTCNVRHPAEIMRTPLVDMRKKRSSFL